MSEVGWYSSKIILPKLAKKDTKLSEVKKHQSNINANPCFEILKRKR